MTPIPEWRGVDRARFAAEIATQYRPAVLRGLVAHWPAVARAKESPRAIATYLADLDSGKPVDTLLAPATARGRIFYNENLTGFNFTRNASTIKAVAEQLLRYAAFDNRPMLAVQSALISDCLQRALKPKGVAVVIEAAHQCMTTRGVHKPGVGLVTSRMVGAFRDNASTRREFLAVIGRSGAGALPNT